MRAGSVATSGRGKGYEDRRVTMTEMIVLQKI
jgi:hypothetical protein